MMNILDESSRQKLVNLLANDLALLFVYKVASVVWN